jgi:hypothetical protein
MRAVACEADRDEDRANGLAEQVNAARTTFLVGNPSTRSRAWRGEGEVRMWPLRRRTSLRADAPHVVLLNRDVSDETVSEYVDRVIMPLIAAADQVPPA